MGYVNLSAYPDAFGSDSGVGLLQSMLVQQSTLNDDIVAVQVDASTLAKVVVIENGCTHLMSQLYDTNVINLVNGLRVFLEQLPVRLIFEEESLRNTTPSLAAKLNIVCIN